MTAEELEAEYVAVTASIAALETRRGRTLKGLRTAQRRHAQACHDLAEAREKLHYLSRAIIAERRREAENAA